MSTTIPESWMPKVPMKRIILHWTAGAYTPNKTDLAAYHFVIDGDGKWHRGVDVAKNSGSLKSGYAAHTLNCNTDSIGVSLACMAGAVESPFKAGAYPMKVRQVDSLVDGVRELARAYGIPVGPKTILTHAEVQGNLGIAQRQKWDYTRIPFDDSLRGATVIGNWLRKRIASSPVPDNIVVDQQAPFPAGAILRARVDVTTSTSVNGEANGYIPAGTLVTLQEQDGHRVRVLTPGGFKVWGYATAFELAGVVDREDDATPSSTRALIASIRRLIDDLEATIGDDT